MSAKIGQNVRGGRTRGHIVHIPHHRDTNLSYLVGWSGKDSFYRHHNKLFSVFFYRNCSCVTCRSKPGGEVKTQTTWTTETWPRSSTVKTPSCSSQVTVSVLGVSPLGNIAAFGDCLPFSVYTPRGRGE